MTRQEALNWFIENKDETNEAQYDWAVRALVFDEISDKINKDNIIIFYFDWDLLKYWDINALSNLFSTYCEALPEYKAALLLPDILSLEAVDKNALKEWINTATEVYESI